MLASSISPSPGKVPLRIAFQGSPAAATTGFLVQTPWLAGAACEDLFPPAVPLPSQGGVQLFRAGELLIGHVVEPFVAGELAAHTESVYRRILAATRGRHLVRIWNYVPEINSLTSGFENYRAFCEGRARGFEADLGRAFESKLPAASAVGSRGGQLDVVFVASASAPQHFENPEQVPAYYYPLEHGPRSPSFARATVAVADGRTWTFISGTAAIKGHQTIAAGRFDAQLDCAIDNLRLISRATGLGEQLGAERGARRHFKIYLRRPEDLDAAQHGLEHALLRAEDVVTYLHAEICRSALDLEIEATLLT